MATRDPNPQIFVVGGLIWLATLAIWLCIPQYRLLDGTIVYAPVWTPPMMTIETGYDRLTEDDFKRLQFSPEDRQKIEAQRANKKSFAASPSWLGIPPQRPPGTPAPGKSFPTNPLLHLTLLVGCIYFAILKFRGIL